MPEYSKAPFPRSLYTEFCQLAFELGYTIRGLKWDFLRRLLSYARQNPHLFRHEP